jgi:hypothetical protein
LASLKAQECILLFPPEIPEIPDEGYGNPDILLRYTPTEVKHVYIAAHIVRFNSGTGGISQIT